jgi:hypothetical protein
MLEVWVSPIQADIALRILKIEVRRPAKLGAILMTMWDFAASAGSESLVEADYASLLAEGLLRLREGPDILRVALGAGLIVSDFQLFVVLLGDHSALELEPGTIRDLPETRLFRIARQAFDEQPGWLERVKVLTVTPPEYQTAISASGGQGTAGARVRWNAGQGFLTAGHVAPVASAPVLEHGTSIQLGTVAWTHVPAKSGRAAEPDVAVIETLPGVASGISYANITTAGAADTIKVVASGNSAAVMGFTSFLYMPAQNHTCGDCYFTARPISAAGDSGGPVVKGADLIGHVIGGSPRMTSYIQDAGYQIREASSSSRSGLPGLRI